MSTPREIITLAERFERNREAYTSCQYNETQLRREFLDPFFEALGWDVNNKSGYAEAYKDVIHEDSIKIGGLTKAPDYCFRIGGSRKFFVEAKKPAVNIRDDVSPAFQLRRYAWSARLPLSILTDFEEFAVYDCRVKPDKTDKSSTARTMFFTFQDYEKRWEEIAAIFSREEILKGSFDRYAESEKKKKGTAEVDAAFLKEIESWRELLARNIALRNPALSQRELNFAVQQTIDRIIFLRICEDRGIEEYNRLLTTLNGANVYQRLCQLFRRADDKYNSGLFHFTREKEREEPDELTLNLAIDDNPLKEIIKSLYYPDSPYEFSVLPADILGQVYEQFLGKVIRLTDGHRAVVEDKPEVKKAGGVYYTPTYIVDYIVKNTVGTLLGKEDNSEIRNPHSALKKMTPKEAVKLRILDPACGSGSFLIGAFQHLIDWHLHWYSENDPESWLKKKNPPIYNCGIRNADCGIKSFRLTTAEKRRILLNNIYGVDIDPQAVEVTKLSLLLKVLEGESDETLSKQLKLFQERALPDLGNNIKCGNSLIGPDFYEGKQLNFLDDEDRYRINVFDWEKEFPEVFHPESNKEKSLPSIDGRGLRGGCGFDAVIGNPPYVRQEALGETFKKYAQNNFESFAGTADLYVYFIEQSHRLLHNGGLFGFIVANKWMRANYGKALRSFLSRKTTLVEIIDFGELPVFENAATFPAIILTKNISAKKQSFVYAAIKRLSFNTLTEEVKTVGSKLDEHALGDDAWTLSRSDEIAVFNKMKQVAASLGECIDDKIYYGIKTGLNEAFVIDQETKDTLIKEDNKNTEFIKPFAIGDEVRKYRINYKNKYLILIPKGWTLQNAEGVKDKWDWFKSRYTALARHLAPFEKKAEARQDKGDYWWELRACDYYDKFEKTKIVYPDIAKESRISFDNGGMYFGNTAYFFPSNDLYLLGILNSKLIFNYYKRIAAVLGDADKGGRLRWFTQDVLKLPIRTINFSDPKDKARHDKMVKLVEQMLSLNKQIAAANTVHEKTILQRQIDATDQQIDNLVYELYGLTEEEISIVKNN